VTLLRLAGAAAIAGGTLRIIDVFLPAMADATRQQIYFVTDLFLLVGAIGLYAENARALRWRGATGFALFLLGILLVRSPQVSFFGAGGYQTGAAIALTGICILGLALLLERTALLAPLMWLGALATGIVGSGGIAPLSAVALAGILFGAGFIALGTMRLRAP
jgi:hypothetical protein